MHTAKKMLQSGRTHTAKELLELGVIDEVTEDGKAVDAIKFHIDQLRRRGWGSAALGKAARISYGNCSSELETINALWVETALGLSSKDIAIMRRLSRSQQSAQTQRFGALKVA